MDKELVPATPRTPVDQSPSSSTRPPMPLAVRIPSSTATNPAASTASEARRNAGSGPEAASQPAPRNDGNEQPIVAYENLGGSRQNSMVKDGVSLRRRTAPVTGTAQTFRRNNGPSAATTSSEVSANLPRAFPQFVSPNRDFEVRRRQQQQLGNNSSLVTPTTSTPRPGVNAAQAQGLSASVDLSSIAMDQGFSYLLPNETELSAIPEEDEPYDEETLQAIIWDSIERKKRSEKALPEVLEFLLKHIGDVMESPNLHMLPVGVLRELLAFEHMHPMYCGGTRAFDLLDKWVIASHESGNFSANRQNTDAASTSRALHSTPAIPTDQNDHPPMAMVVPPAQPQSIPEDQANSERQPQPNMDVHRPEYSFAVYLPSGMCSRPNTFGDKFFRDVIMGQASGRPPIREKLPHGQIGTTETPVLDPHVNLMDEQIEEQQLERVAESTNLNSPAAQSPPASQSSRIQPRATTKNTSRKSVCLIDLDESLPTGGELPSTSQVGQIVDLRPTLLPIVDLRTTEEIFDAEYLGRLRAAANDRPTPNEDSVSTENEGQQGGAGAVMPLPEHGPDVSGSRRNAGNEESQPITSSSLSAHRRL